MAAQDLLAELGRRGVELAADGERLRYRPRDAVPPELRVAIVEHKHALLALLADEEAEVRWRADAMRTQLTPTGPIPALAARPIGARESGQCLSCGDPLGPRSRYRCEPCVKAAWQVLREVRVRPRGVWDDDG
jgi:hypothetical protein